MRISSVLRGVLSLSWRGMQGLWRRPERRYQPDLRDETFVGALLPVSDRLVEARRRAAAGDLSEARQMVVEHFVQRSSPAFFVSPSMVPVLADRLRRERPQWVAALLTRVNDECQQGLKVYAGRHHPPGPTFEWVGIPSGPGGDDLHSVQPHRFGMLPRMALAAHHGLDTLPALDAMLENWLVSVQAGEKECYHSVLAVTMRMLSSSWTFNFIAGLISSTLRDRILFALLKILAIDIAYIAPQIGDAYPNNHLLADGFAAWYGGVLFPEFSTAVEMREQGETLFRSELLRQFHVDGGSFEHSLHYHEMGCEMAVAWLRLSQRNGLEADADCVARVRAMLSLQAAVGGPEAAPLQLGNGTDDPLFPLDSGHGWANGALREMLRALFEPDLTPAEGNDVERAFWLLGGGMADAPAFADENRLPIRFPDGGLEVLRDIAVDARLILRTGPRDGAGLSAGHAHADLLSVYLWQSGVPLIVDAGTFTYRFSTQRWPRYEPAWRRYFAGPAAHNGLNLGVDPLGDVQGDFRAPDIPCRVVERRYIASEGIVWHEFEIVAGVASNVRRGIVHVSGNYWLVYDRLGCNAPAGAEMRLQFAAGTQLQVNNRQVRATLGPAHACVTLGPCLGPATVLEGSLSPLGGWIAPAYGERVAAPQLCAPLACGLGPFAFLLQAGSANGELSIESESGECGRLNFRIRGTDIDDRLWLPGETDSPARVGGESDQGSMLWVRQLDGRIVERRGVGFG